jgi:hypothetical protein
MPPQVLYPVYLLVMGAAAACFVAAYRSRTSTPRHMRLALTGVALDVAGTLVVLVVHRGLGWEMPPFDLTVVIWHRRFAYLSTALMLLVGVGGWRRWRIHPLLGRVFLPVYLVTLALAIVGYFPY